MYVFIYFYFTVQLHYNSNIFRNNHNNINIISLLSYYHYCNYNIITLRAIRSDQFQTTDSFDKKIL